MKRLIPVLLIFLLLTSVASASFPKGWVRSSEIVLQDSMIDANLTNFVILLTENNLPSEMFDASDPDVSKNNGGDIRFSSDSAGTTLLARELVDFDTVNNEAKIWVKIPSILASGGASMWIWYSNVLATDPAEDATYGKEATWSGYRGVWHLEEDGSGAAPQFIDGTAQDYDGYAHNMEAADQVSAKIGLGQDLEDEGGLEEAIIDSGSVAPDSLSFMLETRLYLKPGFSQGGIFSRFDTGPLFSGGGNIALLLDLLIDGSGFRMYANPDGASAVSARMNSAPDSATWYHVVATSDNENLIMYINGSATDTTSLSVDFPLIYEGQPNVIGAYSWTSDFTIEAIIDEMRFSNVSQDEDWVSALYKTQDNPAGFAIEGTPYNTAVWSSTAPDSALITTWNSDNVDSTDGETNPTNLVTHQCKFSAIAKQANVTQYQIIVGTAEDSTDIWDSGKVGDTWDSSFVIDNRVDKIRLSRATIDDPDYTNDADAWLQTGVQYHWKIRFFNSSDDSTNWTADQTFWGVTPTAWDDGTPNLEGFNYRSMVTFGTDHDTMLSGYVVAVEAQTGYAIRLASDARINEGIIHSNRVIVYHKGYSYIGYLAQTTYNSTLEAVIIKYNHTDGSVTFDTIATVATKTDLHRAPALLIGADEKLHIIVSGHKSPSSYYRSTGAHADGSGIDVKSWTSGYEIPALKKSTYPHMRKKSNGDILVFFRHTESTNDNSNWCYVMSDDNGSTWGDRKYVVYFSDYVAGVGPSMYCGGVEIDDQDRVHAVLSFYEGYQDVGQGRAIAYVYSDTSDNGEYWAWLEMGSVDTVGFAVDSVSRGDSCIQLGDLTDTTGIVKLWDDDTAPYDGPYYITNGEGLVIDQSTQYPVLCYFTYTDGTGSPSNLTQETPIYVAYWDNDSTKWDIRNLETDTGIETWSHRNGGISISQDSQSVWVYGFVKPTGDEYFAAELYRWDGIIDDSDSAWSGQFLSQNTGKGNGAISPTSQIDVQTSLESVPQLESRPDGNDIVMIKATLSVSTGNCTFTEIDRVPDAWGLDDTQIKFSTAGTVNKDEPYLLNNVYLIYSENDTTAHDPKADPDNVYWLYDSFEDYAGKTSLDTQGGWVQDSGSGGVVLRVIDDTLNYLPGSQKLWSGEKILWFRQIGYFTKDMGSTLTNMELSFSLWIENLASGHIGINLIDTAGNEFTYAIKMFSAHVDSVYAASRRDNGAWIKSSQTLNVNTQYQLTMVITASGVTCYINKGDDPADRVEVVTDDNHIVDFRYIQIVAGQLYVLMDHIAMARTTVNGPEAVIYDNRDSQGLIADPGMITHRTTAEIAFCRLNDIVLYREVEIRNIFRRRKMLLGNFRRP